MASKEVSETTTLFISFLTIASWQLTWPRCHQFEAQVDCSWVLVCWMLFRWYLQPMSNKDYLSREHLESEGSCNAIFFGKLHFKFQPTSNSDLTTKSWLSISKSKPYSYGEASKTMTTTKTIILQVHLSDRWPGVGKDERLLSLARKDWHAARPHQKTTRESRDALCILFRYARLRLDSRNRSQALRRV